MKPTQANKRELLRVDWRAYSKAPIYTATSAMNQHGNMVAQAKRATLPELYRQLAALRANIARIEMRLSKARKAEDHDKVATLLIVLGNSAKALHGLVDAIEAKGGMVIHPDDSEDN